jgi:hypothetical protein
MVEVGTTSSLAECIPSYFVYKNGSRGENCHNFEAKAEELKMPGTSVRYCTSTCSPLGTVIVNSNESVSGTVNLDDVPSSTI